MHVHLLGDSVENRLRMSDIAEDRAYRIFHDEYGYSLSTQSIEKETFQHYMKNPFSPLIVVNDSTSLGHWSVDFTTVEVAYSSKTMIRSIVHDLKKEPREKDSCLIFKTSELFELDAPLNYPPKAASNFQLRKQKFITEKAYQNVYSTGSNVGSISPHFSLYQEDGRLYVMKYGRRSKEDLLLVTSIYLRDFLDLREIGKK